MLTVERLREVLHYDPETGALTWLVSLTNRVTVGDVAGTKHANGYVYAKIDGRLYLAHRLAVFYVTGEWPAGQVDHRNRNRSDNSWTNLRPATAQQNPWNSSTRKDSASGVTGVYWHKQSSKWHAELTCSGTKHSLGLFATVEDAKKARRAAELALFGEFAPQGKAA